VKSAVDELAASHDEVLVVAHSMGTLLTMEQALCNEKIVRMFFLQSPLRLWIRPRMAITVMKVYLGKVREDDLETVAARHCCGIIHSKNIFRYVGWIPRFLELFEKMRVTRWNLKHLKTPCVACQSRRDEMVSNRSAKLLRKNPNITVHELSGSGHFYYAEDDLALILREFEKFIR
jgi:pimeloyl-ACP methyl ester carboxylesterase